MNLFSEHICHNLHTPSPAMNNNKEDFLRCTVLIFKSKTKKKSYRKRTFFFFTTFLQFNKATHTIAKQIQEKMYKKPIRPLNLSSRITQQVTGVQYWCTVSQCWFTERTFYRDTADHMEEFQSHLSYLKDLKYRTTAALHLKHKPKIENKFLSMVWEPAIWW